MPPSWHVQCQWCGVQEKWRSKELRLQELSQQVRALQQRKQQLRAALDAAAAQVYPNWMHLKAHGL